MALASKLMPQPLPCQPGQPPELTTPSAFRPDTAQTATKADFATSVLPAREEDCADAVPGAGYLVTGDDFSTVRLFNYPVVWDDAPFKAFRCFQGEWAAGGRGLLGRSVSCRMHA